MPGRPNRPLFDYLQDRREAQERREQKRSEYVAPSVGASDSGPADAPASASAQPASSLEPKPAPSPRPEVTVVKPPVRMTLPRPTSPSAFPRPISRESLAEPQAPAAPAHTSTHSVGTSGVPATLPLVNDPPASPDRAEASDAGGERFILGVSPRVLIIAVGVALLVALGGYMVGYRRGESVATVPNADPTLVTPPALRDPSANQPPPPQGKVSTRPEVVAKAPAPTPPPGPAASDETRPKPVVEGRNPLDGSGRLLTSDGRSNADPREAGLNYLILMGDKPGLAEEDAARAIAFMAREGIQVIGVPTGGGVERGAGGANTSSRYSLVALPGFPGRASEAEKSRMAKLQADVARTGQRWRKEERGPADFKDTYWRKHDGR